VLRRRLAAILIADVVGYSRLVEAEESWTFATLKMRRKEIFEPTIREYGGRIVRFMGDAALVEFASAVNAVSAANEIQKKMEVANETLADDRRIILRIGINLGDVIGDGSDIYGEGINIAARLEPLADPGGLCISQKVYDEVHGKVDIAFEDLGEQQLKNISFPVRAYSIRAGPGLRLLQTPPQHTPSIAVLPFVNLSDDVDQQYFSDGITEDIITELSRFRQLRVVARNSSFQFRGTSLDMIQVGRALGVSYLVEGSVRRIGSRIRITAQLIDAKSAHHIWAEKFDRHQEEIFSIQDEVVHTIVATLMGRLRTAVVEGSKRKPPASLAAYECVLRAEALPYGNVETEFEARRLLEKAITIDPGYAQAYAYLANSYRLEWRRDMSGSDHLLAQALALAERSVVLDANDDDCHVILGLVLLHRHAYELAEHHFRKAIDLNPNRPGSLTSLGWLYAYLGRPSEALEYIKRARSLDPLYEPSWYWRMMGFVCFVERRHEETIAFFKKAPNIPFWAHGFLAACYAHLNSMEDAKYHAAEALQLAPDFSIIQIAAKEPFHRSGDRQHLIDGMRKAGLPD
jgi:TolB-like protein/class 3 adenylate cyclase/tetratricopeptide (TPR) repeat protein